MINPFDEHDVREGIGKRSQIASFLCLNWIAKLKLKSPNREDRIDAIRYFLKIKRAKAVPIFTKMLCDPDFFVSKEAEKALTELDKLNNEQLEFNRTMKILMKKYGGMNGALLVASQDGQIAIIQQLLESGANVNTVNASGLTPLMLATLSHRTAVVGLFAKNKTNLNAKSVDRAHTALIFASRDGYTDIVQILLTKGAKVDVRGLNGRTALMYACWHGHIDVIKLLLAMRANVNARDKSRNTPLMYAIKRPHASSSERDRHFKEVVEFLLDSGADVDRKDDDGLTVLWWAKGSEIEALLLSASSRKKKWWQFWKT